MQDSESRIPRSSPARFSFLLRTTFHYFLLSLDQILDMQGNDEQPPERKLWKVGRSVLVSAAAVLLRITAF